MKKDNISYIYDRVSKWIKKKGEKKEIMTQEELSRESTFSRGLISNIESEKTNQTFSLGVLYYLSLKLDIPIELFVKEDISKELKEMNIDIEN